MTAARVLSYLVLVLALVAGGLAPGFAQAGSDMPETSMQAPCHGMDGDLVDSAPVPMDEGACCDGGECRCDCLQHAPAGIAVMRQLPAMAPSGQLAMLAMASHAPALTLPATRPPIA